MDFMIDIMVSQLLVLVLLFIVNFRVFGKNKKNQEVFVVLAPVSLLLSVLLIFAWGLTLPTLLIIILSFLTCLINFYSIIRFFSKLMTGYYGIGLFVFSVLLQVLIVLTATFIVVTRPVSISIEDYSVEEKSVSIIGSYGIGFTERISMFDKIDGKVSKFIPVAQEQEAFVQENSVQINQDEFIQDETLINTQPFAEEKNLPLVFIVAEPRETISQLKPLAIQLASKGYKVYVAEFFDSPFESFGKRFLGVLKKDYFDKNKSQFVQMAMGQYTELLEMYDGKNNDSDVYLVGDGICGDAIERLYQLMPDVVSGFYILNGNTSNGASQKLFDWHSGFGFLGETAPWLLWILGSTDNFFYCRDEMNFNSILAASEAHKVFDSDKVAEK